jgi:hypothetical protein
MEILYPFKEYQTRHEKRYYDYTLLEKIIVIDQNTAVEMIKRNTPGAILAFGGMFQSATVQLLYQVAKKYARPTIVTNTILPNTPGYEIIQTDREIFYWKNNILRGHMTPDEWNIVLREIYLKINADIQLVPGHLSSLQALSSFISWAEMNGWNIDRNISTLVLNNRILLTRKHILLDDVEAYILSGINNNPNLQIQSINITYLQHNHPGARQLPRRIVAIT